MKTIKFPLITLEETPSTNSYLKEMHKKGLAQEGTVVRSITQTAGRGQIGNHWESESEKNLTFSVLLYPPSLSVRQQFLLSEMAALAVLKTLEKELSDVCIKWPNDIYYKDKKICGILIENEIEGALISSSIIGIGWNVNQLLFKSNAPNPVSMKQITGRQYDLDQLLDTFVSCFHDSYAMLQSDPFQIEKEYRQHLYHGEKYHSFWDKNGEFTARIVEIKSDGYLVLSTKESEIRSYLFKEVSFFPDRFLMG